MDSANKVAMGGWTAFNGVTRTAIADNGGLWLWAPLIGEDGALSFNWGRNTVDQKNIGNAYDWQTVAVSPRFGAGIKIDGTLWTWGNGGGTNYVLSVAM